MGQVTHILVIKESLKNEKQVKLLQHSWGYGRTMYLALMDLFLQEYFSDGFKPNYDFFKTGVIPATGNGRFIDVQECDLFKDCYKEAFRILPNADIKDISTIKAIFDKLGNNNGAMVVHIKENDALGEYSFFKVGFLLGGSDCEFIEYPSRIVNKGNDKEPFSRWLTPAQYGKMNGGSGYSDNDFVKMFVSFCKYFGIEFIR